MSLFAQAHEPLPGAEFQARVTERLHRPANWLDFTRSVGSVIYAALAGIAVGITAPFRLRSGYVGVMAASAAAFSIWMSLQP
jgi:hypothetical protein